MMHGGAILDFKLGVTEVTESLSRCSDFRGSFLIIYQTSISEFMNNITECTITSSMGEGGVSDKAS